MSMTPEQLTEKSKKAHSGKGWNDSVPQCQKCGLWLQGVQGKNCALVECPTDVEKYGMTRDSNT